MHKRDKRLSFSQTRQHNKANMNRKQLQKYFDTLHFMNRYLAGYRFALSLHSSQISLNPDQHHVRIQRGEGGGQGIRTPSPLKNHNNIGFLSNTGPDPLKITKLPSQHSMLSHHWHASETPFNGVSLANR